MTSDEFVSWLEGVMAICPLGQISQGTAVIIQEKLKEVVKGSGRPYYVPVPYAAPHVEPLPTTVPPYSPTPFWAGGTDNPTPSWNTICKDGNARQSGSEEDIIGA